MKENFKPSYIKTKNGYYMGKVIGKYYSVIVKILRVTCRDAINDAKNKIDYIINASNI